MKYDKEYQNLILQYVYDKVKENSIMSKEEHVLSAICRNTFFNRYKCNSVPTPEHKYITSRGTTGGLTKEELLFNIGYSFINPDKENREKKLRQLRKILRKLKINDKIFFENGKYYATRIQKKYFVDPPKHKRTKETFYYSHMNERTELNLDKLRFFLITCHKDFLEQVILYFYNQIMVKYNN